MTDQQRGDTLLDGSGFRAITPHTDRLRSRGVTFTQAFAPSPHCCPSRASFHTGLYPTQHGVWSNVNVPHALSRGPFADTPLWSRNLARSGYGLRYSGKWHVSNSMRPSDAGWQELYPTGVNGAGNQQSLDEQARHSRDAYARAFDKGIAAAHQGPRLPGQIERVGFPTYLHFGTNDNPFGDGTVVNAACEGIAQAAGKDEPWFSFVGTLGPHDPYIPPARFLDLYPKGSVELPANFDDDLRDRPGLYRRLRRRLGALPRDEHAEALRHYLAFCTYQDELLGQLLQTLERTGQLDNTVIVFTSDHGDYASEHGLWTKGLPCFRSGYHVPLIIADPTRPAGHGQVVDELVSLVDLAPTFMQLTGTDCSTSFAGQSLKPWLDGDAPALWRDHLCFQFHGNEIYGIQRAILTKRWMMAMNLFDEDELYDLHADPLQMKNLMDQPGTERVVRGLYAKLWKFSRAHDDVLTDHYIATALGRYGPGIADEAV
jgi:arylsulfatase A-like enzyme